MYHPRFVPRGELSPFLPALGVHLLPLSPTCSAQLAQAPPKARPRPRQLRGALTSHAGAGDAPAAPGPLSRPGPSLPPLSPHLLPAPGFGCCLRVESSSQVSGGSACMLDPRAGFARKEFEAGRERLRPECCPSASPPRPRDLCQVGQRR